MFIENNNRTKTLKIIKFINDEIFKVTLLTFILFYVLDNVFKGFVTNFFELNNLLYIIIVTGVIMFVVNDNTDKTEKTSFKNWINISLGILTGIIVFSFIMIQLDEKNAIFRSGHRNIQYQGINL